jgi:2-oxoglutarate dehydrogenase E2 component (dihydrolipoamide succinyltransferase)
VAAQKEVAAPKKEEVKQEAPKSTPPPQAKAGRAPTSIGGSRTESRVAMNRMRIKISQRLKDSQNTAAMLTTFNEIDMSNFINMRKEVQEVFAKKHGVKLGFMSAFLRASTQALKEQPVVNAVIDGNDIVYRDYIDISVAVAAPSGLLVPVIRDC